MYKYAVVALVTSGVALFTLYHPTSSKNASRAGNRGNSSWGLFLLSINLLLDGITNSTQDYINTTYRPFSGSQMMCANNILSTALTSTFLLAAPSLAVFFPANLGADTAELSQALAFVHRHPSVVYDILGFAACGAVGQVFIFMTLAKFSSLLLVTITVTRKMLTMLLSVVWFGHTLTAGQWAGVALVFGGVGAEAGVGRWERSNKERKAQQSRQQERKEL